MFAIVLGKYIYGKEVVFFFLAFISYLLVNVRFNATYGNVPCLLE